MSKTKIAILAVLSVVLAVLVIMFFTGGEGESLKHLSEAPSAKPLAQETVPAPPKTVTLFFLSEDDALLHPEEREIPEGPTVADEIERTVIELIKGPEGGLIGPLPPETEIRQAFVTKEGLAYVDFTKAVADAFAYGSSSEMAAVYAVVNTVAFNFKQVKKVCILIEGLERETLGGHIDLSRPFVPQYSLIAR
jgi:spore germination protein GerM